jgi:hypothetical protein
VATRKPAEIKTEPKLAEAAEKTRVLIQGLQSRLRPEAGIAVREPQDESQEALERQLQNYFENASGKDDQSDLPQASSVLNDIRTRVVDGVVEKILGAWDRPNDGQATPLENEVIERLIERVIERLAATH